MDTSNSCAGGLVIDEKLLPSNVRFQKDLSWNKRVKVQVWKGEPRIDIRCYEDNFAYPLKKGVSLTLQRFKMLQFNKELLSEALEMSEKPELANRVSYHLGGGVRASVTPQWTYVDIRQYFLPEDVAQNGGDLQPTRKGLMLNQYEWKKLWDSLNAIEEAAPELEDTVTCFEDDSHQNQLAALSCKECNPFGNE